jgi:hypothetical protein
MKKRLLRTSMMALLVAVAGHAQSALTLRADVPFNFEAGGAALKAGTYTVNQGTRGVILVIPASGKPAALMLAGRPECAGDQSTSRLVFHRYGNTYLLSQIWTRGENCGRQLPVTRRELELAARQRAPDETIILAIR